MDRAGQKASGTATDQGTGPRTSQSPRLQDTWGPACPPRELRLLLLGRRGAGKSATGNTILGRAAFLTSSSEQTATKMCQRKSDYTEGWKVVVIDTPDIFSSMSPVEDQCHHVGQCLELSAPILHALLLVIPVGHDRAEDGETMEGIQKAFGAEARRHTLVIFTRGDELEGGSIQDYTNSSEALRRMLANYGYRYCAFNNKADEEERLSQVRELLHTVQRMVEENGEPYRVACGRAGDALQDCENEAPSQKGDNPHGPGELQVLAAECSRTPATSELTVLLVGKHGAGKSAAGNSLLGKRVFETKFSEQPVTQRFQFACRTWGERKILIINSPKLSLSTDFRSELLSHVSLGLHAFLLVTPLGSFSKEDQEVLTIMENSFGDKFYEFLIILFTRKEDVEHQELHTFLATGDAALRKVLEKCGRRYGAFSSRVTGAEEQGQVHELLDKLVSMVQQRGHQPCHFQRKTLNLVLVGRSGTGKSATGNTILGRSDFSSRLSAQPVTKTCQEGKRTVADQDVVVVDTPGLCPGPGAADQDAQLEEIKSHVSGRQDGNTILVLVFQLGRFTCEDQKAVELLETVFGEVVLKFTILLFTRKEDLEGQSLQEYVQSTDNSALKKIVKKCEKRVCAFNNGETGQAREDQAMEFLQMANDLIRKRGGQGYSQEHGSHGSASKVEDMVRNLKEKASKVHKLFFF